MSFTNQIKWHALCLFNLSRLVRSTHIRIFIFMNTTISRIGNGIAINDFHNIALDTNLKDLRYEEVLPPDCVLPRRSELSRSSKNIICFHGSPGSKEDFEDLENLLSPYPLHAYPRKNYPGFSSSLLDYMAQQKNQILIGYSWGCRELLEYYTKNHSRIETVILISPFILNCNKSSLSIKSRLVVGFLRKILMKIENYVSNDSRNNQIIQRRNKHTLLKRSLLHLCGLYEKTEHQVISYASILRLITELDTPVHVITGSGDISTRSQQSKELIKTINCHVVCHSVNGGNHDILKTHVHQIARIVKLVTHSLIEIDQTRFRYQFRESTLHHA